MKALHFSNRSSSARHAAAAALLVGALGLLASCGGGGASTVPPTSGPTQPDERALAASQPGELLSFVKTKLTARQAQRVLTPGADLTTAINLGAPVSAAAVSGSVERSGTAVQELGVDEDDLIKTDGNTLVTLVRSSEGGNGVSSGKVQFNRRRADGGLDSTVAVALPASADSYAYARGMYLASAAQRVAVLGESQSIFDYCIGTRPCPLLATTLVPPQAQQASTALDLVNVSNIAAPTALPRISIDGRLVGSRLIGNLLYVVTQYTPLLAVDALPQKATDADRAALIAQLKASDVLPSIRVGTAAAQPLLAETDCYVQNKNASLGIEVTTITVFDLADANTRRQSRCFIGGTEALYMTSANLYLATTRYAYDTGPLIVRFAPQASTDLHKFALSGMLIDYRGSGSVNGHLGWDADKRSYRMSEWGGDLRVLSFTGETGWATINGSTDTTAPPSPATLSILRERASDKTLQIISTLPNAQRPQPLGKVGEQVYGVRMLGARGYVVTFRRVDPLYVLDLSNAADPKAVGEVQAAGFSDYLFPIGDSLLLGVGKDANANGVVGGVKVALFDVADATRPKQLDAKILGERGSVSGLDFSRHGIDLFTRGNVTRVALPLFAAAVPFGNSQHGLQRLEIDSTAKTLSLKPMIKSSSTLSQDLSSDRSVQIDAQVYYFSEGTLSASTW